MLSGERHYPRNSEVTFVIRLGLQTAAGHSNASDERCWFPVGMRESEQGGLAHPVKCRAVGCNVQVPPDRSRLPVTATPCAHCPHALLQPRTLGEEG